MQSGSFSSGDVTVLVSRVLVNGVERPHESWSIDRELSGDLPEQVASVSGVMQATGSVVWAEASDVNMKSTNPWNSSYGWIPAKGDRVEIFAGNGMTEWKQFHGVIDKTTGSVGDGFQSTIIDEYDQLSNLVSHEALLAVMPPSTPGGDFRATGLVYTYYVDLAMRAGRFFTTPPREIGSVVHVPCQGGMWPHLGKVVTAKTNTGASYPSNVYNPWGFAVGNFLNLYEPHNPQSMSAPVQITMIIAPSSNGYAILRAQYGSSYVEIYVDASWNVSARLNGNTVASFAMTGKGGAENRIIQLLVKDGVFRLRSSNGQSATGTATFSGSTLMSVVRADGSASARVFGLQVSHPQASGEFRDIGFTPSAIMNTSKNDFMGIPIAIPAIENVSGQDLLQQIGEASLSAAWIDELGVLQWWPTLAIRARTNYSTLTTLNDIFSLDWEDSILGSRSRVNVKYEEPAIKISKVQNIRVAQGGGGTLESEGVSEDFVEPPPEEVWFGVAETLQMLRTDNWATFNRPLGSYVGGYFSSNGSTTSETGLTYTATLSKLGYTSYKITQSVGVLPADVVFNMETSPTAPSLWDNRRDKPLFDIGAHAKVTYTDRDYTSTVPGGVGPVLTHETGRWIPSDIVPRIADFIATETATPKPIITGLEVAYNPRRQLGDVVTIESRAYMGVTIDALIVGVSNNADSGGYTQSLSVRIVGVKRTSQSYAEYDQTLAGNMTYTQWQALGPDPQTYSEFNNS